MKMREAMPQWLYLGCGMSMASLFGTMAAFPQSSEISWFLVVLALASGLMAVGLPWLSRLGRREKLVAIGVWVQIICGAVNALSAWAFELIAPGVLKVALLVQAFMFPLVEARWGELLSRLELRRAVGVTVASTFVVSAAMAAFLLWASSALVQFFSGLMALSNIPLLFLGVDSGDAGTGKALASPSRSEKRGAIAFLAGTVCLVAAANTLAIGLGEGSTFSAWSWVACAIASLLVGGGAAVCFRVNWNLAVLGAFLLGALTLGFVGLEFAMSSGSGDVLKAVAGCIGSLEQGVCLVTWMALIKFSRLLPDLSLRIFTLGVLAINVGRLMGFVLGAFAGGFHSSLTVLALALVVLAIGCFMKSDKDARALWAVPQESLDDNSKGESDETPVAERQLTELLAARYGLTKREREVLELWMTGRQRSYVADCLFVSESTVKTHLSHIYQKTGAESREQLFALMEEEKSHR